MLYYILHQLTGCRRVHVHNSSESHSQSHNIIDQIIIPQESCRSVQHCWLICAYPFFFPQCYPVVMEDKRRVSILTDCEEGYVQSTKAAGIRLSGGENLESLLRDGKALYWDQKFDEANNSFRRAHDIAHQSQTEGSVTAQIASNISACMLQQRDFHGVLEWTEHVLKVISIKSK